MGLWDRVKRFLPLSALAAGALYLGVSQPVKQLLPQGMTAEQEAEKRRRIVSGFALSGAVALGTLVAAYAAKRAQGKPQALLQPAVEHPVATGLVTAAWAGIPLALLADSPQQLQYAALPAAWLGLAGYVGAAISSKLKPPYTVNFLRHVGDMARLACTRAPEKRQPILESMREYWAQPRHIDLDIVDCLFAQNRVDDACAVLTKTVPDLEQRVGATEFERLVVLPAAESAIARSGTFDKMFLQLRQKNLSGALKTLDTFVLQEPSPTRHAVRALIMQTLSDIWYPLGHLLPATETEASMYNQAQAEWRRAVESVLSSPGRERDFVAVGESRNEVLRYTATNFLKGLLVFKRCNAAEGERLQCERKSMTALRELHGDAVARSLAYIEHDGKAYHVTKHAADKNLEQVLLTGDVGTRMDAFQNTAKLLAQLHRFVPTDYELPASGPHYYHDRLARIFCDELKKAGMAVPIGVYAALDGASERIHGVLKDALRGYYKDANPRNWLVAENGDVTAIDFEHSQFLPAQIDLVSLLEFATVPANDFESIEVLDTYFATRGVTDESAQELFKRQYFTAGLPRHLELAGYRARDGDFSSVVFHLNRAIARAEELNLRELACGLKEIGVPLEAQRH